MDHPTLTDADGLDSPRWVIGSNRMVVQYNEWAWVYPRSRLIGKRPFEEWPGKRLWSWKMTSRPGSDACLSTWTSAIPPDSDFVDLIADGIGSYRPESRDAPAMYDAKLSRCATRFESYTPIHWPCTVFYTWSSMPLYVHIACDRMKTPQNNKWNTSGVSLRPEGQDLY